MAEMTLLGIVQEFCRRRGLPIQPQVTTASDDTTQQMVGLLNEGIQDLVDRYFYQNLSQTVAFVHARGPGGLALDLATTLPDFKAMVANTLWSAQDRIKVEGPVTPQQWAQMVAQQTLSAKYIYRLYQNAIYIFPVAPVGEPSSFIFEYLSRYGVWNPVNSRLEEFYVNDTCYPRIPAYIVLADLKWRWERDRGFPYAEDQRTCEEMVANLVGREPGQELDMAATPADAAPGLYVAAGSWPL